MSSYWEKRTTRRRGLAITGGAAVWAALLAACGGGDETGPQTPKDASGLLSTPVDTTKQAKRGGILKRNTSNDGSLDPNLSISGVSSFHELGNLRLVTLKPGYFGPAKDDEIAPDVAESWEFSPDRLQITLKLRPNVRFHNLSPINGRVLDVDDVLFSWKRFAETSPSRGAIANSANPDAPVLSLTSPDSRTIVMRLKEPLVYVLSYFVGREQVNMMPKEASDPAVLDLRGQMLGAGPFYLAKYEPSVGFSFKRHEDFWDKGNVFVDQIDYPIIPEYAQGLSQFRAGNLHTFAVRQEDVIQLKRDVPAIGLFAGDIAGSSQNVVFGRRTPALRDERVRQAFQMSYDRETWIDILENAAKFEAEGIQVEKRWFSSFPTLGHSFDGWQLDPRDPKTFGPNAKYYEYNIPEAKKLLAAAGFPNGIDLVSTSPRTGAGSGITTIEARQQMNGEAGFRFTNNLIEYATEFIPKYRDALGDFEGIAYKAGVTLSGDPVERMSQVYYSKSGLQFYGFDAAGKGDGSGDPFVDQTLAKARSELDTEKRKSLLIELQRYLAPKVYGHHGLGGATKFSMAWPVIGNYLVWDGSPAGSAGAATRIQSTHWWIDSTKPPLSPA